MRAVSQHPSLNRFIANKQVFARNRIIVSLTVLRNAKDKQSKDEALVKMEFAPDATIDEVALQLDAKVKEAIDADNDNGTADFAAKLVHLRILLQGVVWVARFLDRYGLLPKFLYDVSPFHCSMFLTNMASIGMPALYHHLYNFGNTTLFIAMGKFEKQLVTTREGISTKTVIPLCVTTDERICGGAEYAEGFACFKHMLTHPEKLETRPEKVVSELPGK